MNKLSNQKVPNAEQIKKKSTVQDHMDYLTFLSQPAAGKKPTGKKKKITSIKYDGIQQSYKSTMDKKTLHMISTKKSHKNFKNLRY